MKFGALAPDDAEGGIVVHSIRTGSLVLKEGDACRKIRNRRAEGCRHFVGDCCADRTRRRCRKTLLPARSRQLRQARVRALTARLRDAATCLPETGGVLVVDEAAIDRLNEVDPDITLATLEAFAPVVPGKMIATVKIIPFAVSGTARDAAAPTLRAKRPHSCAWRLTPSGKSALSRRCCRASRIR